ncbi:MAG: TRAP transporter fused permease subunit [Rhodospirillaceae bacterium]|nr:TRAP transporter fused permease subunit [Rhodospirillaceae bacterium]
MTAGSLRTRAVWWAGLSLALFQLVVPAWGSLFDMELRSLHVALTLAVVLLAVPLLRGRLEGPQLALDLALVAVSAVANILVFLNWQDILMFVSMAGPEDLILGAILSLIILEGARRAAGLAIPIFVAIAFAYVFVGPYMPGIWVHPGFPLGYVVEQLYYSSAGIYSSLTGTSATFIAMFILFGALLQATGGGQTFMDVALLIAGRYIGGPAKVGVVSSALFGMISGSAVANVSVTGAYTIPLMRRLGYDPNFAAGVESMASTGGGITPPVMAIAAFIMADFLNIPYLHIIGYATIPCLLFYTGILAGVHFEAARLGLVPVPEAELPKARDVLAWGRVMPLLLPITALLGLLFAGFSLTLAGFWACVLVIVVFLFSDLSPTGIRDRAGKMIEALASGGVAIAQVAPLLVAVSLFTALLGMTGVAPKISSVILDLGAGNLIGALLVASIVPLALGAPLPVTATYILSAALIAPAMVKLQLDVVAVHMFLLYWAVLASVTPPTCTACVIAANISGGDWFKSAMVGMRLGIVAFVVPFFFVINPVLIARGDPFDVFLAAVSGLAGAVLIAAGFFGYFRSRLNLLLRTVYFAAGALLLAPSNALLVAGIGILAIGLALESLAMRRVGKPA